MGCAEDDDGGTGDGERTTEAVAGEGAPVGTDALDDTGDSDDAGDDGDGGGSVDTGDTEASDDTGDEGGHDTDDAPDGELLSIEAPDCDGGGTLRSITALDAHTVEFVMCGPDVAFDTKVASPAFGIHPREHLEATGGGGPALVEHPIGTGPYVLERWDPEQQQLELRANGDYWGDAPAAATLLFRWDDDAEARLEALEDGEVDGIDQPGHDDFESISENADLQLLERTGTDVVYLGLNRDVAPFDDELVRQALAQGLDRQRIVDEFYPPGAAMADQFLPPPIFGFTAMPLWWEYDLDTAQAALDEAGLGDGFEITLAYSDVASPSVPDPDAIATDIRDQLAELGITVDLEVLDPDELATAAASGDLPFYLEHQVADFPDATDLLDRNFGHGAPPRFGAGFDDVEQLLADAALTTDPDERLTLYEEATGLIREHVPMVPIAHGGSGTAFLADVTNAQASPFDTEYFAVMDPDGRGALTWIQAAGPNGLYCADEHDGASFRVCAQITESLLSYGIGGTVVQPGLAETWTSDGDGTVWTFELRRGVVFHDGSALDANDVVASFGAQWDAASPLHTGRVGEFAPFVANFGAFLGAPSD